MIRLLFIKALVVLILSGCYAPKKAVDVLSRPKNEPTAAAFCSQKYPVRDSIIKGDSVVRYDTLWGVVTDTVTGDQQVLIYTDTVRVPKLVTKTITIRDTVIRENTAKVSFLNSQIEKLKKLSQAQDELIEILEKESDFFKSERNKWKLRFFLLLFGVGLVYAAKVKFTKRFI